MEGDPATAYVTDRNDRGQTGLNAAIRPASNELDRMTDVAPTTDERTDLDLVERWKAGEQRAATLLVRAACVRRLRASWRASARAPTSTRWCRTRSCAPSRRSMAFAARARCARGCSRSRGGWCSTGGARRAGRGEQVEVREDDVATEYDALDGVVADELQARLRHAMATSDADSTGSLRAAGERGHVVPRNRRDGGHDGGRGAGSLSQRDARDQGVSR